MLEVGGLQICCNKLHRITGPCAVNPHSIHWGDFNTVWKLGVTIQWARPTPEDLGAAGSVRGHACAAAGAMPQELLKSKENKKDCVL
jgi:hypothetical protein